MSEQCTAALVTLALLVSLALWIPLLDAIGRFYLGSRKRRPSLGVSHSHLAARVKR